MFAGVKIANVAHLALLKIAAAKSVVGVGVLVGGAATGLIVTDSLQPDYVNGTMALINLAVDAEAGRAEPASSIGPVSAAPRSVDRGAPAPDIPQVVITAKRMTLAQKVAYDAEVRLDVLASTR